MRLVQATTAVALLVGLLGCDSGEPVAPGAARQVSAPGLDQSVQLLPSQPASGEQLIITSVVFNRKRDSVAVVSRICGLDTGGSLKLTSSLLMCAGYSMSAPLAPGDSVTGFDAQVVVSPPGRYTLRVRHLLVPDAWVDIPVVVR